MDQKAAAEISDQKNQIVAAIKHLAFGGHGVPPTVAPAGVKLEPSTVELGDLG